MHTPAALHPSACESHGLHTAPTGAQAVTERGVHVTPVQQPLLLAHVVALHPVQPPAKQTWLDGHEAHRLPPEPHAPWALPGMHVDPLQQPPLHDVASQTQLPLTHRWPLEHARPPPHVQAPPDEQPSPVAPHDWQVSPPVPQAGPVPGEVQTLPVQHPPAHDAASQTQVGVPVEVSHRCPAAQAAPAPHRHAPPGEQLLALVVSHTTHSLPSMPQLPIPEVLQVVPEQQPALHEVELQTHAPLTQIWPVPHGALVPHLQAPPVHRSAAVVEQTVHAAPAVPHIVVAGVSHCAPLQHPLGQVALHPVQTLFTQFCVEPQGLHAEPPPPHAVLEVPARHVVPEQHPLGHEVPLHAQAPLTQAWPLPHGALAPHLQTPAVQRSVVADGHVAHEPPPVPHALVACGSQTLPLQQPFGHDVALQAQVPPEHTCPIAHSWLDPHVQAPPEHASDRAVSHAMHVAPAVPHDCTRCRTRRSRRTRSARAAACTWGPSSSRRTSLCSRSTRPRSTSRRSGSSRTHCPPCRRPPWCSPAGTCCSRSTPSRTRRRRTRRSR